MLYNKLHERFDMISSRVERILKNATSHPMSVQSSKLIITLGQHYISKKNMVKNVIGEIVLDIRSDNIEKVFHLPSFDQ